MPRKGQPNKSKGRPRPHLWLSGPDPVRHLLHKRWLLSGCQARSFAYDEAGVLVSPDQEWLVSFDQFATLFDGVPAERHPDMRVCRRDRLLPWRLDNMVLMTRSEMSRRKKQRHRRAYVPEGVKRYHRKRYLAEMEKKRLDRSQDPVVK